MENPRQIDTSKLIVIFMGIGLLMCIAFVGYAGIRGAAAPTQLDRAIDMLGSAMAGMMIPKVVSAVTPLMGLPTAQSITPDRVKAMTCKAVNTAGDGGCDAQ